MSKDSDSSISFGIGLLGGILAGVAVGILYSPKSGEEMRAELIKATKNFTEKLSPDVQTAKEISLEMIDKAKASIESQFDKINQTIKAKKMAEAKAKEEAQSGIEEI
ncbi:MAG: YtxH domain-containing protein [Candidatus Gastranaerophilaceae bacterium]